MKIEHLDRVNDLCAKLRYHNDTKTKIEEQLLNNKVPHVTLVIEDLFSELSSYLQPGEIKHILTCILFGANLQRNLVIAELKELGVQV
jgi:hypothetical protein